MPKIAAANIEEHIRQQTVRVLDTASELFSNNGYRGTNLKEIATQLGLARNSLYRYFPSKDYILVAVMQREMMPFIDRGASLVQEFPDSGKRIDAWLDLQVELATGPCHAMIRMLGDMNEASDELRQQIQALHMPQRGVLDAAVDEMLEGTGRDPKVVSAMIASMVQSASGIIMGSGDSAAVVSELKNSVRNVLTTGE